MILPSLLAADSMRLGQEIDAVLKAGADGIHLDIMDNHYVPNLSFGPAIAKEIRIHFPKVLLDVHLMITPVDAMIEPFIKAGANRISFHPDTTQDPEHILKFIKNSQVEAGLVLNPEVPFEVIQSYLPYLDFVLVMTVNPGFGNQAFMREVLPKIQSLRHNYHHLPIMVDGGVSEKNLSELKHAGATQFVMGSAIFRSMDYTRTLQVMKDLLKK